LTYANFSHLNDKYAHIRPMRLFIVFNIFQQTTLLLENITKKLHYYIKKELKVYIA
jgi:hypothetical protein